MPKSVGRRIDEQTQRILHLTAFSRWCREQGLAYLVSQEYIDRREHDTHELSAMVLRYLATINEAAGAKEAP